MTLNPNSSNPHLEFKGQIVSKKNLRFLANVPENGAKEDSRNKCEKQADTIVIWATPICPMLFPQACSYLCPE